MGVLTDAARRIASGESTSELEVRAALGRIDESPLNAFTFVAHEEALDQARKIDQTGASGLLAGVPVAVKDLFDVRGWPTTACSRIYEHRVAHSDAAVVSSLRNAGAVIVGKTNMHELALGATGDVSAAGATHNPWDRRRMTGGSSSGSAAAVAARIVGLGLGTDTGGSVRIPASLCGVSALKTTHGLLSLTGVIPLALSLDTVGPIAQDALDLALAMQVLSGIKTPFRDSRTHDSLRGVTIGLASNGSFDVIDPAIDRGVREAVAVMEKLGARVVDVALPHADTARDTWTDVALPEYVRAHEEMDDTKLSDELRFVTSVARLITPSEEEHGRESMQRYRHLWVEAFESVDMVALPSTPVGAPLHDARSIAIDGVETAVHGLLSAKTRQINVAGVPALSLPCGFDANGMPFGVQLAGKHFSESFLLSAGALFQSVTTWHEQTPP